MRGQSLLLEKKASSVSARLDNRLKFLEIGRSLCESERVKYLSLLAVIFLPFSLASILSMQTRFGDLTYLLYDFFGVISLLGTMTFILLGIVRLLQSAYDMLYNWMETRPPSTGFRNAQRWRVGKNAPFITISAFLAPWVLTVASFLVAMIHNVGLGLKILGYGLGGMIVLFIANFLVVWMVRK
ncbi:hypothetical protein PSPO01_08566 [Paraphaeosphaeria sporulosa]